MPLSLLAALADTPVAFVDVETTGASARYGHRVTEVGVARVEGGRIVATYQALVDPGRRIGPGITALTGITQAMVDGQPAFGDQLGDLRAIMAGAAVAGHNVAFDLGFLAAEWARAGGDLAGDLSPGGRPPPVFDTVRLARRRFGRGGNGLSRLATRLGVPPATSHRALADAETTHAVFDRIHATTGGWATTVLDALAAQGGPVPLARPDAPASPTRSLYRPSSNRSARRPTGRTLDPSTAHDGSPGDLPWELAEALDAGTPVVMEYLDAADRRTERVVKPIAVRHAGGVGTLVAHCHLRGQQRTFKLDRIVRLTPTEA